MIFCHFHCYVRRRQRRRGARAQNLLISGVQAKCFVYRTTHKCTYVASRLVYIHVYYVRNSVLGMCINGVYIEIFDWATSARNAGRFYNISIP